MPANNSELEKRLWNAADELRANSNLTASQYSTPVLGLIFLRYADVRFTRAQKELEGQTTGRRKTGKLDYQAHGVLYLPEEARYVNLINLPENTDIGKSINEAMRAIEQENEDLKDVLPKTYNRFTNAVLVELLKIFHGIPMDVEGDVFGRIYEYFLGKFASGEGARGGEYFTATSIVKLIVEILEPFQGYLLDPACGSGGMFVQSAEFVRRKRGRDSDISIYGLEQKTETVRLCRMNLAVHGLHGDIKQGNSYYENVHSATGRFDFVMANPPFNVNNVDRDRIKDDKKRYPFGMPRVDNGNYIWIQLFYSTLNEQGRAGFVMANSASDARQSEQLIRKQLIQVDAVDVMVAVGPNFFYNVTLPVTLWFLDRKKSTKASGKTLFLDARNIYRQIDRAHRDFAPAQIGLLAAIARLYRGDDLNGFIFERGEHANLPTAQLDALESMFAAGEYTDIAGLCKVACLEDIEAQDWSLNPGRYVGVGKRKQDDYDFEERLEELHEELQMLNTEAHELEDQIVDKISRILGN